MNGVSDTFPCYIDSPLLSCLVWKVCYLVCRTYRTLRRLDMLAIYLMCIWTEMCRKLVTVLEAISLSDCPSALFACVDAVGPRGCVLLSGRSVYKINLYRCDLELTLSPVSSLRQDPEAAAAVVLSHNDRKHEMVRNPLRWHRAEGRVHAQLALPVPIAQLRPAHAAVLTAQVSEHGQHLGNKHSSCPASGASCASNRARPCAIRISPQSS